LITFLPFGFLFSIIYYSAQSGKGSGCPGEYVSIILCTDLLTFTLLG